MNVQPENLLAILTMAIATYTVRVSGLWIADRLPQGGRARAALDALPPAVLSAVIAPIALATGPAETAAALITAVAAFRLPLIAAVAIGVGSVVVLRALIG